MASMIELARFANITRQAVYEMKTNNPQRFKALEEAVSYSKEGQLQNWDKVKFRLSKNALFYLIDESMEENNIVDVVNEYIKNNFEE